MGLAMSRRRRSELTPAPEALTVGELFELEAWALSKPEHAWAAPHVEELAEACLDHFRAVGEHRADWLATCRTWIRRTPSFAPRSGSALGLGDRRAAATKDAAREALRAVAARRGIKVVS